MGVVGIAVLGAVGFRLYRQVRQFTRDVKAAGERISILSDQLSRESAARPPRS
jgi:hypothetical protein